MVVGKVKRWCSARLHLVKLYLPYTWRDQVLCVREEGAGVFHHHAVRCFTQIHLFGSRIRVMQLQTPI